MTRFTQAGIGLKILGWVPGVGESVEGLALQKGGYAQIFSRVYFGTDLFLGASAITQDDADVSASGSVSSSGISGTASITEAVGSISGTGVERFKGTGTPSQAASVSSSGAVGASFSGTATFTQARASVALSGSVTGGAVAQTSNLWETLPSWRYQRPVISGESGAAQGPAELSAVARVAIGGSGSARQRKPAVRVEARHSTDKLHGRQLLELLELVDAA